MRLPPTYSMRANTWVIRLAWWGRKVHVRETVLRWQVSQGLSVRAPFVWYMVRPNVAVRQSQKMIAVISYRTVRV